MRRPLPPPTSLALAFLFLGATAPAGCSSEPDPGGGGADAGADAGAGNHDAGDPGDPSPDFDRPPSSIEVVTFASGSQITGLLYAEPMPVAQQESAREGSCRLLRTDAFYCFDEPCHDELCVGQDQCAPYPPALAAGALTVRGDGDPVVVESSLPGTYYGSAQRNLAPPGTTLRVEAAGGDLPAFAAEVVAPAAEPPELEDPEVTSGGELVLRWAPVDPGSRVHLLMTSDVFHGFPAPAVLECEAPDTGELTVAAELMEGFSDPENWGCGECPMQHLTRYRRTVVEAGEHEVELRVGGRASFYFDPSW